MDNRKQKELRQKQKANLEAISEALKEKAFIVPAGHPMQPQIADKQVKPFKKPLYNVL